MLIDQSSLSRFIRDQWMFYTADDVRYTGNLSTIDISLVRKKHYLFYQFICEFYDYTKQKNYRVTFLINEYGTIIETKCTCKKKGCVHLIAAVNAINEMDIDLNHVPIHIDYEAYQEEKRRKEEKRRREIELKASTQEAMDLLDVIHKKSLDQLFESEVKPLHFYIVDAHKWGSYNTYPIFRLKIGTDRFYAVSNLEELVYGFLDGKEMRFGKSTYLPLKREGLDASGQLIFDFLYRHAPANNWSRDGRLNSTSIDDFYRLIKQLPRGICEIEIPEAKEIIIVSIEEKEDMYVIHWRSKSRNRLIPGNQDIYANEPDGFSHLSLSAQTTMFLRASDGEGLKIKKEAFPKFYQEVLEPIRSEVEFETEVDLEKFHETIQNVRIYADIEDGRVFVWGKYYLDDVERDLFHGEGLRPIPFIEAIIQRYADSIVDHKAVFKTKGIALFNFLDEGIPKIQSLAEVYISEDLMRLKYRKSVNLNVGFSINNNLLEIDMDSDINKNELMGILRSYRRRKLFHRLKNGELVNLQSDDLEQLDHLVQEYGLSQADFEKDVIQRPAYQALKDDPSLCIRKDETVQAYMDQLNRSKNEVIEFPEKYATLLRDYQKEGVRWMKHLYDIGLNGILADDMGLGKTLQVLCLLECFIPKELPSLIVCPSSLMFNWESEIEKFQVALDAVCVYGTQKERKQKINQSHNLYITTYDYLKRDLELYASKEFMYVILDEAQYIKNPKTKNAKSVKSLTCKHRLALTGTPIENGLSELWSIFDFLLPGYLCSLEYFTHTFGKPIEIEGDEAKQAQLKKMVSPFILRRTKKEVLKDLPDKVEKDLWLDFDKEERKLYLANLALVNEELQAQLKMDNVDSILILSMLTKLRQICCEPRMLYSNITKPSTKLEVCVDLVQTLKENNKKVLLFSTFTRIFDWLEAEFLEKGIKYHKLTGATSKEKRKEEVEAFQNDDSDVFLISLKAGGTGLNLTKASAVIHFDPWWNSSAQSQATDRAYRIGQNQNVIVYQLLMKNSIEEKIYQMQARKQKMSDIFVENNGPKISRMTAEDIKELFSI